MLNLIDFASFDSCIIPRLFQGRAALLQQSQVVKPVHRKSQRCLVLKNALACECLEDLLQRRLIDRVLSNVANQLLILDQTEDSTDCLTLTWNSELEEITALLNQLDLREVFAE
jgi:hypothetical protein